MNILPSSATKEMPMQVAQTGLRHLFNCRTRETPCRWARPGCASSLWLPSSGGGVLSDQHLAPLFPPSVKYTLKTLASTTYFAQVKHMDYKPDTMALIPSDLRCDALPRASNGPDHLGL